MQGNGDGALADAQQVERRGCVDERVELAGDGFALGVGQACEECLALPRVDDADRGHEARDHRYSHEKYCLDASVSDARPEGTPDVVGAPVARS